MRILILGGTSEARRLAELIQGDLRFEALLSLAGRTSEPRGLPLATRIGGFGGVDGLADFLEHEHIRAVVDATHPFAVNISANAVAACHRVGVPLGSLVRPAWIAEPRDRWIRVADAPQAAEALGAEPRRVLLTVGRLELAAFAAAPQHDYIARTIDPAGDIALPPNIRFIQARPPFDAEHETHLMRRERIELVVSKNSGGQQTYGKIEAARSLKLTVVMISRPEKRSQDILTCPEAALSWLIERRHRMSSDRGV